MTPWRILFTSSHLEVQGRSLTSNSSMSDDNNNSNEFQVVRRKRGKKCNQKKQPAMVSSFHCGSDLENQYAMFCKRLKENVQEILLSDFFKTTFEKILDALCSIIESKKVDFEHSTCADLQCRCQHKEGTPKQVSHAATETTQFPSRHVTCVSTSSRHLVNDEYVLGQPKDFPMGKFHADDASSTKTSSKPAETCLLDDSQPSASPNFSFSDGQIEHEESLTNCAMQETFWTCQSAQHSTPESCEYVRCSSMEDKFDLLYKMCKSSELKLDLLCYGQGNICSCPIARYQFALLLVMKEKLKDLVRVCSVYDPVFTSSELEILQNHGCCVIEHNEEGRRICDNVTLAFFPHCGKALYNNFLWANLTGTNGHCLENLVLIGNSFTNMIDNTPERILKKTANYVMKLHPYTKEVPLDNTFTHQDVFNDLSVHTFPAPNLQSAPQSLWEDNTEPVYEHDEAELITCN